MKKRLMKGNEALAEAAVVAGCRYFFGYPITPQNEIPAYMSWRMPEVGGTFVQAESEVAAINMVYGAAGAGARVMTSSSSPGISLKQEGISYIAGAQLPCVIVNIVRGGPGLGGIAPAQSDYFQATKGGGHGDYHLVVFAPASVQEMADLTIRAFDVADTYRTPCMILGDGVLGQMMEPVEFHDPKPLEIEKEWATTGTLMKRKHNVINSLLLNPETLEQHNLDLFATYDKIKEKETTWESYMTDDAEVVLVAYGIPSRICKHVVARARKRGIKVGLIRPITLWPFPSQAFDELAVKDEVKAFLTVEMSMGQMLEDVKLSVNGRKPVEFYGRVGGVVPEGDEILDKIYDIMEVPHESRI